MQLDFLPLLTVERKPVLHFEDEDPLARLRAQYKLMRTYLLEQEERILRESEGCGYVKRDC